MRSSPSRPADSLTEPSSIPDDQLLLSLVPSLAPGLSIRFHLLCQSKTTPYIPLPFHSLYVLLIQELQRFLLNRLITTELSY